MKNKATPLERRAVMAFIAAALLAVAIITNAIYAKAPKLLVMLVAPLYFAWHGVYLLATKNEYTELIANLASVSSHLVNSTKATFVDSEANFYEFNIPRKKPKDFSLGATYKICYNVKTNEFLGAELYNIEELYEG